MRKMAIALSALLLLSSPARAFEVNDAWVINPNYKYLTHFWYDKEYEIDRVFSFSVFNTHLIQIDLWKFKFCDNLIEVEIRLGNEDSLYLIFTPTPYYDRQILIADTTPAYDKAILSAGELTISYETCDTRHEIPFGR